jgi:subtilase family serine protease
MQPVRRIIPFFVICLLLAACTQGGSSNAGTSTPAVTATQATKTVGITPTSSSSAPVVDNSPLLCPAQLAARINCQTPRSMRVAYGVESLMQRGFTGKGQTIVDIVSFGSPTLQADMDVFDRQFYLPPITIKVLAPIGTVPFDPASKDMTGWASETNLDVQVIHAIAPDANIVVLTSPVSETEGTIGLPEFLKLEQYAVNNHLGTIISQSWGASEVTLKDSAGQQEIQKWDAFFKQATTQQGITFFASSGDHGATDVTDLNGTILSKQPTTSFPTDDPWVTSVGGTALSRAGISSFQETAWNNQFGASGGGYSTFFSRPVYQGCCVKSSPGRGVPDVSGNADPTTALAIYFGGWPLIGGTSASAPLWAAIAAIANQMAGHALGFLNPALYKLAASSSYPQDFHDITKGNNTQDVGGTIVPGYAAAQGWDPVTGLGSPNAEKLIPDLIAAMKS